MPRLVLFFLLTIAAVDNCRSQSSTADKQGSIKAVVVKLFNALSELDTAKVRACLTPGATILESGKVWNFDSLALRIVARKAKSPVFKRVNEFDFLEANVSGKFGYVSYFNHAVMTYDGKTTNVRWIETAVLRKDRYGWRISLLHSTELERTN